MLSTSHAITCWLYPTIGFDSAALGRDVVHLWLSGVPILTDDPPRPSFRQALSLLQHNLYLTHLIQLVLHYPDLCQAESNNVPILSVLEQTINGVPPATHLHLDESLTAVLTRLATDSEFRRRACRPQPLLPGQFDFLERGPAVVTDYAKQILAVLSAHGLPAILIGSLALFLQRPFRLSPDIDISVSDGLTTSKYNAVLADLEMIGVQVTQRLPGYLAGRIVKPFAISVDIEIGTAYHYIPFDDRWLNRAGFVEGCAAMGTEDLVMLKRRSGRLKDIMDIAFLQENS